MVLDRILGGEHDERPGKLVSFLFDGCVAFGHSLEQRRLGLGGGPVYFIGQYNVGKDGASLELEQTVLLIEDLEAHDIRGQQIRSELDTLKRTVEAPSDRLGECGLAYPRHILD